MTGGDRINAWAGTCFACRHWKGDRDAQAADLSRSGHICMSTSNGWPKSGGCGAFHSFAALEILGDATAEVEFDANFGCNRWERLEET